MCYCSRPLVVLMCSLAALAQERQPDPKQRERAVRELAKRSPEAIPQIEPYLSDPVLDVRLEAVKALTDLGTGDSVPPLLRATRDNDPSVQVRAVEALVNFYYPGYIQSGLQRVGTAIRSRFTDTNDIVVPRFVNVREDVVAALGRLASGGSSMESRAVAARAIGVLRGRAALPDLVRALHSKDDTVIYEALIAIQKIGDPAAAPRVSFLLRDLKKEVQIAAVETTGLLRNREALPDLHKVLQRTEDKEVRRAAVEAIGRIADASSREVFLRYLNDRDEGTRAAAAEGLGRLKNPADRERVEKLFAGSGVKGQHRLALAFAAAHLGKTELSEFSPLQYVVNNLNSSKYRAISEAYLIELAREPAVRSLLHTIVHRGTRDEKIGLGRVLAASGDASSLPYLEKLSKDSDEEVAQESLRALRNLRARL